MARASPDVRSLTDCMYFLNGHCRLTDNCRYRHYETAANQTHNCFKWPKTCRNLRCPYRHPSSPSTNAAKSVTTKPMINDVPSFLSLSQDHSITFFWDIENVPIPRGQKPFDIVQRIREKLVVKTSYREDSFSCYCNISTISTDNQLNLQHANIRIVHVPDRKPGAVDRQIMLELGRFERSHRPPATIVLISGDIDFVGQLSDLRHHAGFHVTVIHNRPAKEELKATVNEHYPWDLFTQPTNSNEIRRNDNSIPDKMSQPSSVLKPRPVKQMHACPSCSNDFESIQALRQHQEAKNHIFECPVCDESFFTLDGQIQHQNSKTHFLDSFQCDQCNRSFTKIESLNQHRQATGHLGHIIAPPLLPFQSPLTPLQNNTVRDPTTELIQLGIGALIEYWPKLFNN